MNSSFLNRGGLCNSAGCTICLSGVMGTSDYGGVAVQAAIRTTRRGATYSIVKFAFG
jgi:hypothetical protein